MHGIQALKGEGTKFDDWLRLLLLTRSLILDTLISNQIPHAHSKRDMAGSKNTKTHDIGHTRKWHVCKQEIWLVPTHPQSQTNVQNYPHTYLDLRTYFT